ncbi:18594_t:CDS:2, partial [Racocetra fulgida]
DKDNTVIVLKVEKTGEILGGYNPLNWERIRGRKYKKTDASFIFSLKINEKSSSKLSRVKNEDVAICCMEDFRPSFGYFDLYMSSKDEKVWGCSKANYEKEIKIAGEFLIEDYEVFQLSYNKDIRLLTDPTNFSAKSDIRLLTDPANFSAKSKSEKKHNVVYNNKDISLLTNSANFLAKSKSEEKHNLIYDNIFDILNCIELLEPCITIKSKSNSGYKNCADYLTITSDSNFMSVRVAVSQGITSTACDNIERLLSLLNKQKTAIYNLLDKQHVYAVGPDFQKGYSVPCIACWTIEPISKSIIKQLSALFDHEFEIIIHVNSNVGNQDKILDKHLNSNNGDDGGSKMINPFIQVSSVEIIDTYLWANISTDEHRSNNVLEFSIDLFNCGVGEMLSEICQLSHGFVGYYLDSIRIG